MWNACKQEMFPANATSLRWTQCLSRKKLNKLKLPIEKEGTDIPKGYLQPLNRHMCCVSFQVKIMQPPRVCHTEQYCTCLKNGSYLILEKMPNIASFKGSTNATSLRWAAITERNWSPKGHLPIENESLFTCKGYCSLWIHKVVDRDCSCQVGLRLRHHHYVFLPNMVSFKDYYFAA